MNAEEESEVWTQERAFWLEGREAFERGMARDCMMVFPEPAGILVGDDIIAGLEGLQRWSSVDMSGRKLIEIGDTLCLAYRAHAVREGQEPYSALCASTYILIDAVRQLVLHQHTPV